MREIPLQCQATGAGELGSRFATASDPQSSCCTGHNRRPRASGRAHSGFRPLSPAIASASLKLSAGFTASALTMARRMRSWITRSSSSASLAAPATRAQCRWRRRSGRVINTACMRVSSHHTSEQSGTRTRDATHRTQGPSREWPAEAGVNSAAAPSAMKQADHDRYHPDREDPARDQSRSIEQEPGPRERSIESCAPAPGFRRIPTPSGGRYPKKTAAPCRSGPHLPPAEPSAPSSPRRWHSQWRRHRARSSSTREASWPAPTPRSQAPPSHPSPSHPNPAPR